MSSTVLTPTDSPVISKQSYELKSELLRATLPRNQKNPEMFMTWLNTLCAVYLGVGILGARNPHLFTFRPALPEEAPLILEAKTEPEMEKAKPLVAAPDEPLPESLQDQLPVVVPIPVLDIKDVTFARAVEGMVTADTKKLGTFDRAVPNIGIVGTVAKPGNPNAQTKPTNAGSGRRRLTAEDVDYGPPVPKPSPNKHGRVEIDPNSKIWVTFGEDGAVTEVRIDPPFSHAGYEREVRAHIKKHWHSKIGANSGWAPIL